MQHQQNMTGRRIAVLIVSNNNRRMLEEGAPRISRALERIDEGVITEVMLGRLRRRQGGPTLD